MPNVIYHYPPDLLNLLVDTIPLLCRSKQDTILFLRSAGVSHDFLGDIESKLQQDKSSINKFAIVRTVLTRLNEKDDATLRERREVVRRVTEYEDFSTCWPDDQLKAKGLVSEIRRVVDVKDSFTRINQEREAEAERRRADYRIRLAETQRRETSLGEVKKELYALFGATNKQARGKSLEAILNRLFALSGILVREAFTLAGDHGEGVTEQIDGVIELDGHVYLVEMKWLAEPVSVADVSQHLVRIFNRNNARGIFISASGYTEPAIKTCSDSLTQVAVVLCGLDEIVKLLERKGDLEAFLRSKINAAIIDRKPLHIVEQR